MPADSRAKPDKFLPYLYDGEEEDKFPVPKHSATDE